MKAPNVKLLCLFFFQIYGQNEIIEPFGLTNNSMSSPSFVDIDRDGDMDAFSIGTADKAFKIYFQENTGTDKSPNYAECKFEPFGLTSKSLSSPSFVDIDRDGDMDAFSIGTADKAFKIHFQENTGTDKSPNYAECKVEPFGLTSKSLSSPSFVDIDGDGDMDAFAIGTAGKAYKIYIQENTGTDKSPNFAECKVEPFGLTNNSISSPSFVDIDRDGDMDAFAIGTADKAFKIYFQENTGTDKSPNYAECKFEPFGLTSKSMSSPSFVDIDGDGVMDAFAIGTAGKAYKIYMNKLVK